MNHKFTDICFITNDVLQLRAFHYPHNNRSKRVIEKCGFKYETTIEKGSKIYDGQVFDSVCHSILKADYFNSMEKSNITIKPLTPELAEDYVRFFDVTPHSEKPCVIGSMSVGTLSKCSNYIYNAREIYITELTITC